jgi:hypothetical protein
MIGLLNVGSLIFGLIAWILPVVNLAQRTKQGDQKWGLLSVISISACAIALNLQFYYINYLVNIEDWSALMDITGAQSFVASVLVTVTILLNAITLIVYRLRKVR